MGKKFTDEQLIQLIKAGYSNKECSEKLGVTASSITQRRKKLGKTFQVSVVSDAQQNMLSVPAAAENLRLLLDETKEKFIEIRESDTANTKEFVDLGNLMLKIISFTLSVHRDLFKSQERQQLKQMLLDLVQNKSQEEQKDMLLKIRNAKAIESFISDSD